MTPHPRSRKALKWFAAITAILLAIAWLASSRWMVVYQSPRGHNGSLIQGHWLIGKVARPPAAPGVLTEHDFYIENARRSFSPQFNWWFYSSAGPQYWLLGIPGWLPTVLAAALAAFLFRRDHTLTRRTRFPHLCPRCHYDRTGIAQSSKCPECGSAPN